MCRYAFNTYKPHYACFECRKMFKRRLIRDVNHGQKDSAEAKCPQCGGLMADMGLDFKAPKKDDSKSWEHIRNLYSAGITYHSCGCSGPGYIPATKEKIEEYLEKRKESYISQLRYWINYTMPETKAEKEKDRQTNYNYNGKLPKNLYQSHQKYKMDKQEAVDYWTGRIGEIDKQIELLK